MSFHAKASAYKTKYCPDYLSSRTCQNGELCTFAHGKREIRSFDNPLYKSQLCTAFSQTGVCSLDDDCLFAHSVDELRLGEDDEDFEDQNTTNRHSGLSSPMNSPVGSFFNHGSRNKGRDNHMPPPCHAFQKNGFCQRGSNCPYSHVPKDFNANNSHDLELKFKTALCHAFQKNGRCANGDNCRYAHGEKELQPLPPKTPPAPMDPNDPKYKTKLCIKYEKEKKCAAGDKCNFAHGVEQLRNRGLEDEQKNSDRYKTSVCQVYIEKFLCPRGPNCTYAHGRYELRPIGFKGDFDAKIAENPRWKCNLCKVWCETNRCKNGEDCGYAHGEKELRSEKPGLPEVRRFKTELCKKLFTQGFCPQGSICTFAHSDNELSRTQTGNLPPSTMGNVGSGSLISGFSGSNSNLSMSSSSNAFSLFSGEPSNGGLNSALLSNLQSMQSSGMARSNLMDHSSAAAAAMMGRTLGGAGAGASTSLSSQPMPQPIGTKSANKEVEMFSEFLEFMKWKESGVLDLLKNNNVGMLPRPMPGHIPGGMQSMHGAGAGAPGSSINFANMVGAGGVGDSLGSHLTNGGTGSMLGIARSGASSGGGGGATQHTVTDLLMASGGGVGSSYADRVISGSGHGGVTSSAFTDLPSPATSQLRKRKYQDF